MAPLEAAIPHAYLIAAGPEDDAAYIALHDLALLLAKHPDARVIGGHMVSLIAAAFPSDGLVERRTGDADAGIPIELATSGDLHDELLIAGYEARNSNRYVKPSYPDKTVKPTIDLLIPTFGGRFGDEKRGDRSFNTMPGLNLALGSEIRIAAHATLRGGNELAMQVPTPGIEAAVILKAYAWRDRRHQTDKDAIDISNLLHVLDQHGAGDLGGWTLRNARHEGARGDAAHTLYELAEALDAGRVRSAGIDRRKLVVLIRRHVAR